MHIQQRTFSRGYYFKRFEGAPVAECLALHTPSEVAIPLKQGFGEAVPALVKYKDAVSAGQIIGRNDDTISSPILASVSGRVNAIEPIEYFDENILTVFITPEGSQDWQPLDGHSAQWRDWPINRLEELLYLSGVTRLGSSGIPTSYNSSPIAPADVEHVIVHHAEAEIFNDALAFLLKDEQLTHFIEGLAILKRLLQKAHIHLAFNYEAANWLFQIAAHSPETFFYTTLKPKYPQHHDAVLLAAVLDKKLAPGALPASLGVLTFTVPDVLHIYEAVVAGKPLIERLLSLSGPGFTHQPYLRVRIGTSFEEVMASRTFHEKELRFVANSLVTGRAIVDATDPVTIDCSRIIALEEAHEGPLFPFVQLGIRSDSNVNTFLSRFWPENNPFLRQFLPDENFLSRFLPKNPRLAPFLPWPKRLNTNIHGEKRGCLSCGFCSACCPAQLYPNLLHRYVERKKFDEALVKFGIFNCLECNLCTYLCPSKIPVAQLLKEGKEQLIRDGFAPDDHRRSLADAVTDLKKSAYWFFKDLVNLFMEW